LFVKVSLWEAKEVKEVKEAREVWEAEEALPHFAVQSSVFYADKLIMRAVIEIAGRGKWFWLRVWLYGVPSLLMALAAAIYWIAPQVDWLGHVVSLTLLIIGLPYLVLQSRKLEQEHGLNVLPNRTALLYFFGGIGLLLFIGFDLRWEPKRLLGFPVTLGLLASLPSLAVIYKVKKPDES
jgi:hypothetical protein